VYAGFAGVLASIGKRLRVRAFVPPWRQCYLRYVEPQVTIPFPPDLFEALAQRVAELLREQPSAQRYLTAEAAAAYLGIPVKTLRTKDWRDREGVPYGQLPGGKLVFDRLALDERFASASGPAGGSYAVARVSASLGSVPR
jgi:hypothetical protein